MMLEHCVWRRGGQSQSDIGEISRGIVLRHVDTPLDHTHFDGLPLVLPDGPSRFPSAPLQLIPRDTAAHLSRMSRLVYL